MFVAKSKWPECVKRNYDVYQCKSLIDDEIVDMNEDTDKFIRTIVVGKRKKADPLGNSIVIYMDDHDRAMGRDKDGMVYYDL